MDNEKNSLNSDADVDVDSGKRRFLFFGGIVATIAIFSLTALVLFFYIKNPPAKQNSVTPKEEISTKSEAEILDYQFRREDWSFEVLNGSNIAGIAGRTATKLIEAGYKVIIIDNADRSNYNLTELTVSKGMPEEVQTLLDDLRSEITISTYSGQLEDSTASARIILGRDQALTGE